MVPLRTASCSSSCFSFAVITLQTNSNKMRGVSSSELSDNHRHMLKEKHLIHPAEAKVMARFTSGARVRALREEVLLNFELDQFRIPSFTIFKAKRERSLFSLLLLLFVAQSELTW